MYKRSAVQSLWFPQVEQHYVAVKEKVCYEHHFVLMEAKE